jgi:hypothetical protein
LGDVVHGWWLGRCEFFVDQIKTHEHANCAEDSGNGPKPPDFVCRAVPISEPRGDDAKCDESGGLLQVKAEIESHDWLPRAKPNHNLHFAPTVTIVLSFYVAAQVVLFPFPAENEAFRQPEKRL